MLFRSGTEGRLDTAFLHQTCLFSFLLGNVLYIRISHDGEGAPSWVIVHATLSLQFSYYMVNAAGTKDTAIIGIVYFTDITAIFNFAAITYTVASITHSHAAVQLRVDNRSCQGRLNTSALGEVLSSGVLTPYPVSCEECKCQN